MKKSSLLGGLTHAATHPVSTASFLIGLLRGIGAELTRTASGQHGSVIPGDLPGPVSEPAEDVSSAAKLHLVQPEAAPQQAPAPPGEAFVTEPTAVSRGSAHGGRGRDADIDDWLGDAEIEFDSSEDPAASSVVEALERNDRPGDDQVDHSAVKSVLSESERLKQTR